MTKNVEAEAPDPSSFCPEQEMPTPPSLRFPGGFQINPTIDPTRGIPLDCSFSVDLVRQISPALAVFQPILMLLDFVGTLGQVLIVMTEVVQNPLKIGKLLALMPGLTQKFNELLALIPVLPQGVARFASFVVDVISIVRLSIVCATQALESVKREVVAIESRIVEATSMDDADLQVGTLEVLACSKAEAQKRAAAIVFSLAPVAKLLCTIKTILSLIPGGAVIANRPELSFPDVSGAVAGTGDSFVEGLDVAIDSLQTVSSALETVRTAVEVLSGTIVIAVSPLEFSCGPVDESEKAEPASPEIAALYSATDPPLPLPTPFVTAPGPDTTILIAGTNFDATSQVWFGTEQVPPENLQVTPTRIVATIPAELLGMPGEFKVSVVNSAVDPESPPRLFSNVTSDQAAKLTKVSSLHDAEVGL